MELSVEDAGGFKQNNIIHMMNDYLMFQATISLFLTSICWSKNNIPYYLTEESVGDF